ncbi:GatB/YqeY domain-containing protein [Solitalea sp. MAHUQ-68]|uniref:GatB/YqeY domain-containing protein n=1 Tax=Solitalea agri TaxID=2953739 RepID=A0A9X2F2Y2_9SPHI|nr:GatB/YqeY domain-containing protein [Solitalea agri]MCO4293209.1 GatB/YqeY domain-containing protein [Solitalea agri]
MSLLEKIDQDIKKAMLAKEEAALRGLRAIKAALLVAKTEKGAAEVLSEDTEVKVLQKQAKQRKESADIYLAQNRPDLAKIEQEELDVIESYLPKQLSEEEIEIVIKQVILDSGAAGMKDMGKVMGLATKQLGGQADGKIVSAAVKKLLA